MSEITAEDIAACHFERRGTHVDGRDRDGKWFADVQRLVEHPRLSRTVQQWMKRTKRSETFWSLDGEVIGTLENTLAAYNALPLPPVSITEHAMLDMISDDWMPAPTAPIHMLSMRDKGLIEFNPEERGQVRRTELARTILKGEK